MMNFGLMQNFIFGAIFIFLCSFTNLHSSLPYMSLEEMSDKAELIFVGEVISTCTIETLAGQVPSYGCNLSIKELVKNHTTARLNSTVVLRIPGLRTTSPFLTPGEHVFLFCSFSSTTAGNAFYLTNGKAGVFRLRYDQKLGSFFVYSSESDKDLTYIHPKPRGPSPVVGIKFGHLVIGRYGDTPLREKEFIKAIKGLIKIQK